MADSDSQKEQTTSDLSAAIWASLRGEEHEGVLPVGAEGEETESDDTILQDNLDGRLGNPLIG